MNEKSRLILRWKGQFNFQVPASERRVVASSCAGGSLSGALPPRAFARVRSPICRPYVTHSIKKPGLVPGFLLFKNVVVEGHIVIVRLLLNSNLSPAVP